MFGIPWRLIVYVVALLAILGALWGYGHHKYELGVTDERARWTPQLVAAQQALAAANAKTITIEHAQVSITTAAEARHAAQIQTLTQRALGADSRIAGLLRKLAAPHSCGGQLPAIPGTPGEPDAAASSDQRIDRAAAGIAGVGTRCERDAAALGALQDWIREQQALAPR